MSTISALLGLVAVGALGCTTVDGEDDPGLDNSYAEQNLAPVIFVHGCTPPGNTDEESSHLFDPLIGMFREQGYPDEYLIRFVNQYEQCTSTLDFAEQLRQLIVDVRFETGAPRVDIVAHSMGALSTRLMLASGGDRCVRDFASIAGANHGTTGGVLGEPSIEVQEQAGGYPAFEGFFEMFPPYSCWGDPFLGAADTQAYVNGCLTSSGRSEWVDETLDGVNSLSIRNAQDEIIDPVESSCLDQRFQNDCSSPVNVEVSVPPAEGCGPDGCPAHLTVLFDPDVMAQVYQHIAAPNFEPGEEEWESLYCSWWY